MSRNRYTKTWPKERCDRLDKLLATPMTLDQIATEMNTRPESIKAHLSNHGLKRPVAAPTTWTPERLALLRSHLDKPMTRAEVAVAMNMTEASIKAAMEVHGIRRTVPLPRKTSRKKEYLQKPVKPEESVIKDNKPCDEEILSLAARRFSASQIAAKTGLPYQTIRSVLARNEARS